MNVFQRIAPAAVVALCGAATIGIVLWNRRKRRQVNDGQKLDVSSLCTEKGTVYLCIFPRKIGLGVSSSCLKVETFLRIAKVPYTAVFLEDPWKSPTGRLPFLVFNGEVVPDAQRVVEFVQSKFNPCMPRLSQVQLAKGTALRRVCEDSLRLHFARHLYVDNVNYLIDQYSQHDETIDPKEVRESLLERRARYVTWLFGHGQSGLTNEQFHAEFLHDVKCLEGLLDGCSYAVENQLTEYDASVFASLYQIMSNTSIPSCPALECAQHSPVLRTYFERVLKDCFPDAAAITAADQHKKSSQEFKM